jgi:hypothetical protein
MPTNNSDARERAREVSLAALVAAWDALPQGDYLPGVVERWLAERMAPAIAKARQALTTNAATLPADEQAAAPRSEGDWFRPPCDNGAQGLPRCGECASCRSTPQPASASGMHEALIDCLALIRGEIAGESQRRGIIQSAEAALAATASASDRRDEVAAIVARAYGGSLYPGLGTPGDYPVEEVDYRAADAILAITPDAGEADWMGLTPDQREQLFVVLNSVQLSSDVNEIPAAMEQVAAIFRTPAARDGGEDD